MMLREHGFFFILQRTSPCTLVGFDLTTHNSTRGDDTTRPRPRAHMDSLGLYVVRNASGVPRQLIDSALTKWAQLGTGKK
jgi:hypothetical protein